MSSSGLQIIFFLLFLVFVVSVLFIDLKVIGKKSHILSFREAFFWTGIWILLALGFYFFLHTHGEIIHGVLPDFAPERKMEIIRHHIERYGQPRCVDPNDITHTLQCYRHNLALEYLTGYLIEYSLSVDNIFVMIMIFLAFGVQRKYYKRVLFWGILGAIVMRFLFIFIGAALIIRFEVLLVIFGVFLVYAGIRMFMRRNRREEIDTHNHPVVRFASRYFAVFPRNVRHHFFIRKAGKWLITPLMIVLLVIEFSDVLFAVDSVPAIFSVTKDPFIVFFSNIFAIIGLRSLFFLVTRLLDKFRYLHVGLAALLTFIGLKLIYSYISDHFIKPEQPFFTTVHSLYIILGILAVSIIASLVKTGISKYKGEEGGPEGSWDQRR
jgi:tellurite resistance protein TerC